MAFVEGEAFRKIDIIHNKDSGRLFIFFFIAALLGYAAILTSSCPYNDDYIRYVINHSCAGNVCESGRYAIPILEYIMFLSHMVCDATPLTQIVSCLALAFTATICVNIFCSKIDAFCGLFFANVVINPYMIENMIFRFDNMLMILALLCVALAAYLSVCGDSRNVWPQTALLLGSLLLYQAALSAYFIVFLYLLMEDVSRGKKFSACWESTRGRIYTMAYTAILYLPIAYNINYAKRGQKLYDVSFSLDYLNVIMGRICCYFENIYNHWGHTHIGLIVSVFVVGFIVSFLAETWKNKSSYLDYIFRCIFLIALMFVFSLAPIGVTVFLNHAGAGVGKVAPRIIYTFGMTIAVILYKSSFLFKKIYFLRSLYKIFAAILFIWNLVFGNVVGNLLNQKCIIQNSVSKDIADDLYTIKKTYEILGVKIINGDTVVCNAMVNFIQEYPFLKLILTNPWEGPIFSDILLKYNGRFFPRVQKGYPEDKKGAKKIRDRMWYDLYLLKNTLIIDMKDQPLLLNSEK